MKYPGFFRLLLALAEAKGRLKLWDRVCRLVFKNSYSRSVSYDQWKLKYHQQATNDASSSSNEPICLVVFGSNKHEDLLHQTIESILAQKHPKIQVLVSWDGPYNDTYPKNTVRFVDSKGDWQSLLPNEGWMVFMHAGDKLLDGFTATMFHAPPSEVVYCDSAIRFNEEANDECHFKPSFSPYTLASRNFIGRSFAVRAHCLHPCEHAFSSPINHHALLLELYGKGCAFLRIPGVYYLEVENGGREPKQIQQIAMAIEKAIPGSSALVADLQNGYFDLRFPINDKPLVSVIIPSRDAAEMCHKCLSALFNKTHYPNFEVLLIDNGSKDPSFFSMVEGWQNRYPARFRVIRDDAAFNFSRLMNLGAHNANGSVLLLMNNDVEAIHADWMDRMVEVCMRKDVGVTSAKLLYPNNTVQHAGAVLGLGDAASHILVGAPADAEGYYGNLVCLTEYSIMTAACMMVTKEIYWSVNGFEEALSVEFNDFDFCLKVHAKGKHNLMIPQATLYHHESITRGHPRENPKTYKRYVGELNKFKNTWSALIPNDPAYNPYLSKVFDDFRMG